MTTKYDSKKHLKSAWVARGKDKVIKKPWGYEKIWSGFSGIHGKILFVEEGKKTSLKFHKMKNEVLYLMSGKIDALIGNESTFSDPVANPLRRETLFPGDALLVQSACPYRIIAVENSKIIEIGNYMSETPTVVFDDYGRESDNVEELLEAVKSSLDCD